MKSTSDLVAALRRAREAEMKLATILGLCEDYAVLDADVIRAIIEAKP